MQTTKEPERAREHLLVQVQPWTGAPMERECLRLPPPGGTGGVAYGYLGDMQLRFVFDQPGVAAPAAVRPEDLERLQLTPQQATALAVRNTLQANAPLQVAPLQAGVYALRGRFLEYNATSLLDRAFWRAQLEKFPQGLLAALPRKGLLLFAPAGADSERALAQQAGRILDAADTARISSGLYRFDAQGWHPHGPLPRAARAKAADDDDEDDAATPRGAGSQAAGADLDLDKAASGQRMLVFSILGGFVLNAVQRAQVHPGVGVGVALLLTVYSLVGVVRLGSGLGRSRGTKISLMVLTCVPLVNLATWIVLSVQATRALRAAGWKVGLLGARE